MTVAGQPLDPPAPLTILMHKPLGVVCSHREAGRSVYELLPARWRARIPALSTIGRLDKETSGLLLITDDGPFLHRVISPKSHIAKRYLAKLDRPLEGHEAEAFAAGTLMLEGEKDPLAPAVLEPTGARTASLTITEGRYHQVRRMFAAVGNHVTALHRDRIGGLVLPAEMEPGAWRVLAAEERAAIFVCGPRKRAPRFDRQNHQSTKGVGDAGLSGSPPSWRSWRFKSLIPTVPNSPRRPATPVPRNPHPTALCCGRPGFAKVRRKLTTC
jgi:16S rRNA pseudouridine516 synthase